MQNGVASHSGNNAAVWLWNMGQRQTIHFVDRDSRSRAEAARLAHTLGYHAEVYAGLAELAEHQPREGIIVARDEAGGGGPAEIVAALCAMGIWLPVVIASEVASMDRIVEAVRAGALDYLHLPPEPRELGAMIERTSRAAPADARARRLMIEARGRLELLSEREREVLDLLSEGSSNKRIARELSISPRTVEIHRANMMQKLGAKHVAEVVRLRWEARL